MNVSYWSLQTCCSVPMFKSERLHRSLHMCMEIKCWETSNGNIQRYFHWASWEWIRHARSNERYTFVRVYTLVVFCNSDVYIKWNTQVPVFCHWITILYDFYSFLVYGVWNECMMRRFISPYITFGGGTVMSFHRIL